MAPLVGVPLDDCFLSLFPTRILVAELNILDPEMLFILDVLYTGYRFVANTCASLHNRHGLRFLFPFSSPCFLDMVSLNKARADG